MHSGPDRFHHLIVIVMTKLKKKKINNILEELLFIFFLLSGDKRSDHFAFQKMFSIKHRNLIFCTFHFFESSLKTKSTRTVPHSILNMNDSPIPVFKLC